MKIRTEVNLAMGSNDAIDEQAPVKLSYIRACVKEALRLNPPTIANMRTIVNDTTIMGYKIPKGTMVALSSYVMSWDPNVFENPDTFIPERWFEREDLSKRSKAAHSTFPFSIVHEVVLVVD
ncbi:hypothetical protein THRCLA_03107 [Thraustotheca clavata]|uniref:Cytochrome P450 n=1 Tax=Thraustotheca clavata TaxID=74557 RepID=A0A1W0A3Q4_9STRA|nr:hypothetical protein THRCLA_03107 [Thraustotheca clavata]